MIKIVHESTVELIDHMGSDLTVVNAARVSFDKTSSWIYKCREGCQIERSDWENSEDCPECEQVLKDGDAKLIKYLAAHNHWSPFGHVAFQFRVSTPIFVARQLVKHQVGLIWNEVSRRYVSDEPEFYFPKEWRGKAENKKQGSSDEIIELKPFAYFSILGKFGVEVIDCLDISLKMYNDLLKQGVCPEQARMVLPQNMMTSWYWSGSLHAFCRIVKLRDYENAQKETREVAIQMKKYLASITPISFKYLIGEK